ncbi:hypothetical protein Leryth_021431 [Lithospermum erythrorhizon]|nr:hypothetical protein Leryth_021431 [Lithospermum erythrorhizon]
MIIIEEIRKVVDVEPNDLNVGCKGGKRRLLNSERKIERDAELLQQRKLVRSNLIITKTSGTQTELLLQNIQRLGYYFSEALSKKINKEMGRTSSKNLGKSNLSALEEAMMGLNHHCISESQ